MCGTPEYDYAAQQFVHFRGLYISSNTCNEHGLYPVIGWGINFNQPTRWFQAYPNTAWKRGRANSIASAWYIGEVPDSALKMH